MTNRLVPSKSRHSAALATATGKTPAPYYGNMHTGYTFIERNADRTVENTSFRLFSTLDECCAAAEEALDAGTPPFVDQTEVIRCDYDERSFTPHLMVVLKTFRRRHREAPPEQALRERLGPARPKPRG